MPDFNRFLLEEYQQSEKKELVRINWKWEVF